MKTKFETYCLLKDITSANIIIYWFVNCKGRWDSPRWYESSWKLCL